MKPLLTVTSFLEFTSKQLVTTLCSAHMRSGKQKQLLQLEGFQRPFKMESIMGVLDLFILADNVYSTMANLCTGTRSMGRTRAHEVHKGCWQIGGMTDTGVLWRHPVPSWGVPWLMCISQRAMVNMQWSSVVFALSKLQTISFPSYLPRVYL